METERSKELREYLQKTLKLPSAIPEPEEDPEFYDRVHTQLKPHHETLHEALQSAYPNEEDLRLLVKQEMGEDLGKIPNARSDINKLHNTIEWMDSNGYLLEFVAAAHRCKERNAKLNLFVRKPLFAVLEPLIAPPQVPIATLELPSLTPAPLAKGSNERTNNHDTGKSNGKTARRKKAASATPEVGQDYAQPQPPPLLHKVLVMSHEDPIALAREHTDTARKNMQSVYEIFQNGEKLSEAQIVASIRDAKETINGISAIFDNIPIPDHPELDYMFACEEKYICGRISAILAYALQGIHMNPPPSNFQKTDKEFKKIFSGLQKLETFIAEYQQQIQLPNRTNESLLGNGS